MEEKMISNTKKTLSLTLKPWRLYQNPLYSHHYDLSPTLSSSTLDLTFIIETTLRSMKKELEESNSQIKELKAELEFEAKLRKKMESLTKNMAKDLEDERRGREAAERVCDELDIQILGHEAEIGRIRREIDEEKKMMRVAEVFREGKVEEKKKVRRVSPITVQRRTASPPPAPEPENPHIKRGIKGSVEFQRAVKAMYSNKSNKHMDENGSYKLECQKAQLKILLKHRSPVKPSNFFIS